MYFQQDCIKKYLDSPAYGLIPVLVFVSFWGILPTEICIIATLFFIAPGRFLVDRANRFMFDISLLSVSLALFSFYAHLFSVSDSSSIFIFCEIYMLLLLLAFRLFRRRIIYRMIKHRSNLYIDCNKAFRFCTLVQYAFSTHLLLILSIYLFSSDSFYILNRTIIIKNIFQIVVLFIFVFEIIRYRIIAGKLKDELWLPVVSENGMVSGRVAQSVSNKLGDKLMHPVVRLILIYNGKFYLKQRARKCFLNPGTLDTPFCGYLPFNEDINDKVRQFISEMGDGNEVPFRFLQKYIFENDITKRLVFLYVSEIEDEQLFMKLNVESCKFWTENQIDENLNSNLFSESFEQEYEYLKNTVLMVRHIKEEALINKATSLQKA